MRKLFSLLLCVMAAGSSFAQNQPKVKELEDIISNFFYDSKDPFESAAIGKNRPSEAIMILLEVDSSGKVSRVSFLVDDKNKDSGYSIISRMQPLHFKNWTEQQYKNKTIIVPFTLLSGNQTPGYVSALANLTAEQKQIRNLVIARTVHVSWLRIIGHETNKSSIR